MKNKLYYVIPFVAVPLLLLICDELDNTELFPMTPCTITSLLLIFSVVVGFSSTTHRMFDYLLVAIMPISLFCFMFVGGFLSLSDVYNRFNLYKAVKTAFLPIALQLYFLMAITTFFASFKHFRKIKKLFKKLIICLFKRK